jgi:hypothetical protein
VHRKLATALGALILIDLASAPACRADDWCTKPSKPENIVVCADPELRRLAVDRIRLLDTAHRQLSPDTYQHLSDNEVGWTASYTAKCGVAAAGPTPPLPISQNVIDCYKRETEKHIADLNISLHQEIPGYQGNPASPEEVESDRKLRQQAQREQEEHLTLKLQDLGYTLKSAADFDLDWHDLAGTAKKIAVRGYYGELDGFEYLKFANNRDLPWVRLSADDAPRDARKVLLDCRNNAFPCPVVIGATVKMYIQNKGQLDEKKVPLLAVQDVFGDK